MTTLSWTTKPCREKATVLSHPMERGLPRPVNSSGLPVPYLASGMEALGKRSMARQPEVIGSDLCQVCGLSAGWPAFGVIDWSGSPKAEPIGLLDYGLLHEACLRLALTYCPELKRWERKALVMIEETDVLRGSSGLVLLPPATQVSARVGVGQFRRLDPTDQSPGR
jgi:hypothetical protein